jgi:hypothetical protein
MLYEKMKDGQFPKQILLGKRAVGWAGSLVDDWIRQCTKSSPAGSLDDGTGFPAPPRVSAASGGDGQY